MEEHGELGNIEDLQLSEDIVEKIRDPEVLRQYIEEGKTFQEILKYDEKVMEKLYGAAYLIFQQKRYQDSADAFSFLTMMNPYVHNYWLGLAMSEQLIENYEEALVAYGMAIMTDINNPVPVYHSASCAYLIGDTESAIKFAHDAIELAGDKEEYAAIKKQAQEAKNRIKAI